MRILIVSNHHQELGGTERYLLNLLPALQDRGHTVSVLAGNDSGAGIPTRSYAVSHLPALTQPSVRLDPQSTAFLNRLLDGYQPDLVYLHNITNETAVDYLAAARPSVRYVHDHRLSCPRGNAMFPFGRGICRFRCGAMCYVNTLSHLCLIQPPGVRFRSVRSIRRTIASNRRIRLLVASRYMQNRLILNGLDRRQVSILPYFIDVDNSPESDPMDEVLFVGRLVPEKGLAELLAAMSCWPRELTLIVAGDGPFRKEYQERAKRLGLSDRVIFLGAMSNDQLRHYYERCLVVVVPSIWGEPFGIVGLEAMAYAKPVVAFDVGGVREWLVDGETGFLVPRKDLPALSEQISRLHVDRVLARQLGEAGRRRACNRFSRDLHVRTLERIFAEVTRSWRP